MKAYRLSVNLKLGLVLFAVLIAVASLVYTNRLVNRLREREQFIIRLWGSAQEQLVRAGQMTDAPFAEELQDLKAWLQAVAAQGGGAGGGPALPAGRLEAYRQALEWAESMPAQGEVTLASEILLHGLLGVPAIIVDSAGLPQSWLNVPVEAPDLASLRELPPADSQRVMQRLLDLVADMSEDYAPIPIQLDYGERELEQYIYYAESRLVKELRIFPYLQLLFTGLFILVGYLGFSYIRRSEQSSLWVGMAKEAAHQLGTPISSLMGWHELLQMRELPPEEQDLALEEIEKDISRLRRVASRFSDIGSLPKLEVMPVGPVIQNTADYMRRRFPQSGKRVSLEVAVPPELRAPLNAELFEWVIENLLKNALDAIETTEGRIDVTAHRADRHIFIDVQDTGKGIDRRQWKNIFRPGYSTKKRGWGLGLSLAKRIVEDYHGGSLTLAGSRVGHGSTFRIQLPAA